MSTKRSRRRFLIDLACLGGAMLGAALVPPRPFFEQYLEGQDVAKRPDAVGTPVARLPEDAGPRGRIISVTRAFPSDSDAGRYEVTCAYPSDSDKDLQLPRRVEPAKEELQSSQPFFQRFLS